MLVSLRSDLSFAFRAENGTPVLHVGGQFLTGAGLERIVSSIEQGNIFFALEDMHQRFDGLVVFEVAESSGGGDALIDDLLTLSFSRFLRRGRTVQDVDQEPDGFRIASLSQRGDGLTLDLQNERRGDRAAVEQSLGGSRGTFVLREVPRIEVRFL